MYGLSARRAKVDAALEQLGLADRQRQLAGQLSGGWKQRLALAACVLHQPKLLLLDEPTAGVDPKARREFWDKIHDLAAAGLTGLVSTHYMDEAERCHEIAYLAYGKLLARGTVAEVIAGSALSTWEITGGDLNGLANELERLPGVEMAAPFGASLHVSGSDAEALERSLAPYGARPGLTLERSEPSLEDVFIHLMATASDNFAGEAAS
jgi:ABC-2 type transport system ATP-binding protein